MKKLRTICCDFESFYSKDYGFKTHTTEAYVRDLQWETIGVATKVDDGEIIWVSGDYNTIKAHLLTLPWDTHLLLCQNTAFDGAVLNWIYGIKPIGYLDTQSMANALHGVSESSSLANLAKLYGEVDKGNAVHAALGKRRCDFTMYELAEYGDYCKHDVELTYNIFYKMLEAGFPRAELRVVDLTIRMFCEPVLELDQALLEEDLIQIKRTKRESLDKLKEALGVTDDVELKKQVMSNPKFAALLQEQGVTPPTKISKTTGKEAFAFAKTDEALTDLLDHENPIVSTLVETRLENKSTIKETRTESFIGIAKRGTFPFGLSYSGAKVTHRWSGSAGGSNPQNLPRGSLLRKAVLAPEGYSLVVADSSNIELRSGMWLAGQEDALQQIRDGIDLYKMFASEAFNMKYEDIAKDSNERFIAKVCCLSLTYSTGAKKLQDTIRTNSKGKITVSDTEAERLKNLYREKYYAVVESWRIGTEIIEWIYHNQHHTAYGFLPVHGRKGILKPSGLYLPYPRLRQEQKEEGWGKEWFYDIKRGKVNVKDRVYGGKVMQRCLSPDTEVLTNNGWKQLINVADTDLLWDGEEWVNHDGVIYKGEQETIKFVGVDITPHHMVYSQHGKKTAIESDETECINYGIEGIKKWENQLKN